MAFKRLLQEIEDKFNEVNLYDMEDEDSQEPYYVEVSVRDAKKAMDVAHDARFIHQAIRSNILNMDGSNVYKSNDKDIIEELLHLFREWNIEVTKSNMEDLDEESGSGGAGAYLTPNAFGHEAPEKAITAFGMKKVNMKNKNTKSLQESVYKRIMNL
jgi:hypothetical protein